MRYNLEQLRWRVYDCDHDLVAATNSLTIAQIAAYHAASVKGYPSCIIDNSGKRQLEVIGKKENGQ